MTLIITALTDDAIVQASDRRLTRGRAVHDDEANKAICVACSNATFTLAYTGIAGLAGARMDDWLLAALVAMDAGRKSFPDIMTSMTEVLTSEFQRQFSPSTVPGLSVALGGFGTPGPFGAFISNMEAPTSGYFFQPRADFELHYFSRNARPLERADLMFHGCREAVSDDLEATIPQFRVDLLQMAATERAEALVSFIREAADHPNAGYVVGRSCMTVVVPREGAPYATYHPEIGGPESFGPHFIREGMVFSDVSFSLPPGWSIQLGGDDSVGGRTEPGAS